MAGPACPHYLARLLMHTPSLHSQVRAGVVVDGKLNPNIVGQSIPKLAALFGIKVRIWGWAGEGLKGWSWVEREGGKWGGGR